MVPSSFSLRTTTVCSIALLLLPTCLLAFTQPTIPTVPSTTTKRPSSSLSSTVESVAPPTLAESSLEKLETIKLALKRPRGASVGVEYAPTTELSDGDLRILSMQLRKSKCAAIYTSDMASVAKIASEQESSRGDFPGPVPVVYCGEETEGVDGATAVVVEYGEDVNVDALGDVGVIWKVDSMGQMQELADSEEKAGGVFMLSQDMLPKDAEEDAAELKEALSGLPKSVVTIAPLPTMLPENAEISLGKHYASLGISSQLLQKACVGDEEDVEYSRHAIEGIGKKSSSSFSMTGLTGSTNGHFGVASHGGEVKWRRNQ